MVDKAKISEPVRGVPQASKAFVFYQDGSDYCAVTEHRIKDGALGPGRVVSMRSLSDKFATLTKSGPRCLLPENVFLSASDIFGWVSTARFAPMWFNINGKRRSFRVWWPNLLWLANRQERRVSIFVIGSNRRPTLETRLYNAPLMNIGSHGDLCEGSARLPRKFDESAITEIENCVYESNFTHVNHDRTIKNCNSNQKHIAYWRGKEATGERVRACDLVMYRRLGEVLQ